MYPLKNLVLLDVFMKIVQILASAQDTASSITIVNLTSIFFSFLMTR